MTLGLRRREGVGRQAGKVNWRLCQRSGAEASWPGTWTPAQMGAGHGSRRAGRRPCRHCNYEFSERTRCARCVPGPKILLMPHPPLFQIREAEE